MVMMGLSWHITVPSILTKSRDPPRIPELQARNQRTRGINQQISGSSPFQPCLPFLPPSSHEKPQALNQRVAFKELRPNFHFWDRVSILGYLTSSSSKAQPSKSSTLPKHHEPRSQGSLAIGSLERSADDGLLWALTIWGKVL